MHKLTTLALILCGMIAMTAASETFDELDQESSVDPRFLFVDANGTLLPINGQLLLSAIGLLSTLALFGIGIWLLLSTLGSKVGRYDYGYGGHGGYGGYGQHDVYDRDSSYSEYQAR